MAEPTLEDFSAAQSLLIGNLLVALTRLGMPNTEVQALVEGAITRAGADEGVKDAIRRITAKPT